MIDRRLDRIAQRIDTAARMKPAVDRHIMQQLDECDTQATNETGITQRGTINDPVINAVLRRGHIIDRSNEIDAAVVDLERAEERLRQALKRVRPEQPDADGEPICHGGDPTTWGDVECHDIVESREREYGAWYHPSGLCPRHRRRRDRYEAEQAA